MLYLTPFWWGVASSSVDQGEIRSCPESEIVQAYTSHDRRLNRRPDELTETYMDRTRKPTSHIPTPSGQRMMPLTSRPRTKIVLCASCLIDYARKPIPSPFIEGDEIRVVSPGRCANANHRSAA